MFVNSEVHNIKSRLHISLSSKHMYILLSLKSVIKNIIHMRFNVDQQPADQGLGPYAYQGCNSGKKFPQTDLFPLIGLLFLEIRFTAVLQLCKSCSLTRVSTKSFLSRKFCFRFHYRNNHHIVKVLYIYYCYISTMLAVLDSRFQYCILSQKITTFHFLGVKKLKFGI